MSEKVGIFVSCWCSECSHFTWHIQAYSGILVCLECRASEPVGVSPC